LYFALNINATGIKIKIPMPQNVNANVLETAIPAKNIKRQTIPVIIPETTPEIPKSTLNKNTNIASIFIGNPFKLITFQSTPSPEREGDKRQSSVAIPTHCFNPHLLPKKKAIFLEKII
jgi:hypothetical protein